MSESPIVAVSHLVKEFDTVKAVRDISFSVMPAEIFAFLGPNGAGKSTTIKMLTTLLEPTSGEITINGFHVKTQKDDVRKSFGIVFQDQSLDDELTAYENMEFHAVLYNILRQNINGRIQELLLFVELWERRNELVKNFSGGMKRRLEIARGLLHKPRIFFLDEPTIGLDPQTRAHIWEYIKNLRDKEGITIFFTTHYMEEAQEVADRVAVIDQGKLVAQGTTEELIAQTQTTTLEQAFLKLTGSAIRDEEASGLDRMRVHRGFGRH